MRIALGVLSHEANTFSPRATTWADFEGRRLRRGAEMLRDLAGLNVEEAGAMSVLEVEPDCEVIPLLAARALSGGPLVSAVWRELLDELLARLEAAQPLDGLLLVLHGAMMAEDEPDATGQLLQAARQKLGPALPIVGTLDLHANVTERMVRQATALVGYHTTPHIDQYETGQAAARLLLSAIRGQIAPTMALVRLPMLLPAENARHTDGPLAEVLNMILVAEKEGAILHGSIYPVQPWLDIADVASSVLMVTNGDVEEARRRAGEVAREFWARRGAFLPELVPPDEAVRRALSREGGTVLFCDSADSPTSGSTGDSTVILQALLYAAPLPATALLNIVDAPAVAQALAAGVGAEVTVRVGGTLAPSFYMPLTFKGYVKTISDGVFRFKGPGMRGVVQRMGRTVVLTQGGIHLVVMERPVSQWDPQLYRSLGEEPTDARIVQVKSPAAFRAAYGPLADEILIIRSPGISTPQFDSLPWRNLRRPTYPLDPQTSYQPLVLPQSFA